jgi:hypothetical protein
MERESMVLRVFVEMDEGDGTLDLGGQRKVAAASGTTFLPSRKFGRDNIVSLEAALTPYTLLYYLHTLVRDTAFISRLEYRLLKVACDVLRRVRETQTRQEQLVSRGYFLHCQSHTSSGTGF